MIKDRPKFPEDLHHTPYVKKELCADCHGGPQNRGHNFSAVDATCVRCHEKSHESKMAKTYGCRSCHFQDFLIPISSKKPAVEKFDEK